MTVARAFDVLGEPATKKVGPSWVLEAVEIEIPVELLERRLAHEPASA